MELTQYFQLLHQQVVAVVEPVLVYLPLQEQTEAQAVEVVEMELLQVVLEILRQ